MTKNKTSKPIKEMVFSTRNKAVILYSKLFGPKKTNKILNETFSNITVISKILEAEKHGFEIFDSNGKEVALLKVIMKPGIDIAKKEYSYPQLLYFSQYLTYRKNITKYKEKYWKTVRKNLLKLYDEETTDAIIEHYNPHNEFIYNWFGALVREDKPDAEIFGLYIMLNTNTVLEDSNIEKKVGSKIIKYKGVNSEDILAIFIDSHIQVFGSIEGIPSASATDYLVQLLIE